MPVASPPRRLPPTERREQLLDAALAIAASEGHENLAFEAVAARAGVTRNLLYHYFPGGQPELLRTVAERAGEELTRDWVTDTNLPLAERLAANFDLLMDHAEKPSDAWLVHRQRHGIVDAGVLAIARRYHDRVISNIALNQLGTEEPPPVVRMALDGFLAYAETVLESAAREGLSRETIRGLLASTLAAAIAAAVAADQDLSRDLGGSR